MTDRWQSCLGIYYVSVSVSDINTNVCGLTKLYIAPLYAFNESLETPTVLSEQMIRVRQVSRRTSYGSGLCRSIVSSLIPSTPVARLVEPFLCMQQIFGIVYQSPRYVHIIATLSCSKPIHVFLNLLFLPKCNVCAVKSISYFVYFIIMTLLVFRRIVTCEFTN